MSELINIWLEEHDGNHVAEYRGIPTPRTADDDTFEFDNRRWRWSHTYRAFDQRTGDLTVYRAARPVDWLAS